MATMGGFRGGGGLDASFLIDVYLAGGVQALSTLTAEGRPLFVTPAVLRELQSFNTTPGVGQAIANWISSNNSVVVVNYEDSATRRLAELEQTDPDSVTQEMRDAVARNAGERGMLELATGREVEIVEPGRIVLGDAIDRSVLDAAGIADGSDFVVYTSDRDLTNWMNNSTQGTDLDRISSQNGFSSEPVDSRHWIEFLARDGGFEPSRAVVELHGTCRECRGEGK